MLSCSIWFSAPSFWMGGGLESRCVGRVYGADGARHHPHCTHDLHSCSQDHHPSKNSVRKTICCNSTSNGPNDGRMRLSYEHINKITSLHQVGISHYFMRKMHSQTTLKSHYGMFDMHWCEQSGG